MARKNQYGLTGKSHLHHMYVIIIAIIIRRVENNKDDEKVKPQLNHRYRELTESWCTLYLWFKLFGKFLNKLYTLTCQWKPHSISTTF